MELEKETQIWTKSELGSEEERLDVRSSVNEISVHTRKATKPPKPVAFWDLDVFLSVLIL